MIDTIGLRSISGTFEIKNTAKLQIYPAQYSLNTGELINDFKLFDIEGNEVSGNKAILNKEKFQVTIDSKGLYCQLSIPKYAKGSNYKLSDAKETKEVLQDLEKSLFDEGIHLDIKETIPARIDGCKNIKLEYPTGNYFSFIPSLGGRRMNSKSQYNDGVKRTGFQWSNSQQEIICYDKRIEMETRKENLQGIPKHILRFEHRLRTGRKIKDALGFFTTKDLINDFGRIEENYNKVLSESIFKYEPNDKRLFASHTIEEYLLYALTNYKRNVFNRFSFDVMFSEYDLIIDKMSMLEMLESAMEKLNYNNGRKRINRFRLKQKYEETKKFSFEKSVISVRELYAELRSKLLKVA